MQLAHQRADVADHRAGLLGDVGQEPVGGGLVTSEQGPSRVDALVEAGQGRPEPVVQVALQPSPLVLPGDEDPLAGLPKVVVERRRPDRGTGLARQAVEEVQVGGA